MFFFCLFCFYYICTIRENELTRVTLSKLIAFFEHTLSTKDFLSCEREPFDRSKHGGDVELKLCVEYGHLSACRLMDMADLSLWRIKLQAFRRGYGSHRDC